MIRSDQEQAWMAVLASSAQHDFHHLPGYHRLAESHGEGTARLFAYRDGDYMVALPLLLRPIDASDPTGPMDATSVYGYGGPVASHAIVPPQIADAFQRELRKELVRRRVIAVFSRLHPLIDQQDLLMGFGEVKRIGLTVSVDLTIPPEAQWAGYSKQCRRIIRKAREAGIVCVRDEGFAHRREWAEMYLDTMRRVNAPAYYHFDEQYFEGLSRELGQIVQLFVALLDGRIIAAGLFTHCDGIVQAHLSALKRQYMHLSPARLIDDTARAWACEIGARTFHLGGGVGGRDDSLFLYKSGFSDRRHQFAVWRWVLDADAYRDYAERQRCLEPSGESGPEVDYFPAYRRPPSC